jgi:7-cyano-7-deazaguanine synthase in queuosine biosynthesis
MNTTRSSILVAEVPGYTELQREMHDALRAQHPEWIEADGKSPTCDYYESRFAQVLVSHRTHARALTRPYSERPSASANSSIPVGYAEARNIVFSKVASAIR